MKQHSALTTTFLALVASFACGPGFGQVIIEGGRNGAQISNRDGRTEVPRPANFSQTVITSAPSATPVGFSNGINRSVGVNSNRSILSPRQSTGTVSVVRTPQPSPGTAVSHVVDVRRIQKQREMERELEVIKTTSKAWMAFDANRLFDSRSGSVRYQSRALLDKILAYRTISGGKSITVDYEYFPGKESPESAALRASAIVDYLSIKSGLSPGWFTINPPKPVQPVSVASTGGYQPPAPRRTNSIINIRIQR